MADDTINQPTPEDSESEKRETPLQIPELTEIDMLSTKIIELENSVNLFKDQLLRKAAEFENFKRRTENDYASIVKYSNEELITRFLPVLDDFERSMKAIKVPANNGQGDDSKDNVVFMKGMELIYNKFLKLLEAQGVKHFEVVGKPFDPHLHDALLQMPRTDVPPHTVIEEVDKGYMLNDKVIRHARVVVSADPVPTEPIDGQETRL